MIPTFPKFKILELSDRKEIDRITQKFPPLADYNFLNLWSWDITEKIKISTIDNNLVIKFADYLTQKPFFSFLGSNNILDTARTLLEFSRSEGLLSSLKLIPENVAIQLEKQGDLEVVEDRDNFDYILSIEILKNYPGNRLSNKRNHVKRFKNGNYKIQVKNLNLDDKKVKEDINSLFDRWAEGHQEFNTDYERIAINRFLDYSHLFNLLTTGVYIDDKLEAFWSHEFLNQSCTISHFEKANASKFVGLYAFLVQETAKLLSEKEIFFINFEQDLGIKNLRQGKEGYLPYSFLKKFIISGKT